eukprot:13272884-Heterocapsa_arctica.AAC.1
MCPGHCNMLNGYEQTRKTILSSFKNTGGYQVRSNPGNPRLLDKGWTGVWHPAKKTQKQNIDGRPGKSGGVAILVWN